MLAGKVTGQVVDGRIIVEVVRRELKVELFLISIMT